MVLIVCGLGQGEGFVHGGIFDLGHLGWWIATKDVRFVRKLLGIREWRLEDGDVAPLGGASRS
jgi:hypothetical protein